MSPAPAENLIHAGWSRCMGGVDAVRDSARRGVRVTGNAVAWWWTVLLRLAYLGATNAFALLRLLPVSSKDKDAEILALATSSLSCSGSSVRAGCGSPRVTGRCWRHCCTGSRGTCSRDCTWWCARIPCSAGTVIWSRAGTPSGPGPGTRAGRVPYARFVSWWCDWSARIPGGGTAGCTASCWCSA